MIPALVLTAGLGTRLDPITHLVAKPAVPLAGRTLIERILGWLVREGVTDAVLNLHHLPETIAAVVGDGRHLGLRVRYSWEPTLLGSAGGPRHALSLLDAETFLIVNGDTLAEIALAPMIARHAETGADVTLAAVPNPAPNRYNGMVVDADDRVTGIVPKGRVDASTWHFVGVQVVRTSVFAALPDGVPVETITGAYRERMAAAGRIRAWRVSIPFTDVGTPRDYLAAAQSLGGVSAGGNVVEAGASVGRSARLSGTLAWPSASIGDSAVLDGCIVTGVAIPPSFRASDAVLLPPAVARADEKSAVRNGVFVAPFDR